MQAEPIEPIEPDLLRKYIAYSRQTFHPVLSREAADILTKAYVGTRNTRAATDQNAVPITLRNLLSMTRLAYASARLRFSQVVEAEDAERAAELELNTYRAIGIDPDTGTLDSLVIETGQSKSSFDRTKTVRDVIKALSTDKGYALVAEVREAVEGRGISPERCDDILDRMRTAGELFNPDWDRVKLV